MRTSDAFDDEQGEPEEGDDLGCRSTADGSRILLAEDDRELRAFLKTVLVRDGYDVIDVPDGSALLLHLADGCSCCDQPVVDLLITDDRMPGWTGMQVLAGLTTVAERPPIILMTAFADELVRARATMLGAAAVLDKPFDVDDFRAIVCNLLTPRLN